MYFLSLSVSLLSDFFIKRSKLQLTKEHNYYSTSGRSSYLFLETEICVCI